MLAYACDELDEDETETPFPELDEDELETETPMLTFPWVETALVAEATTPLPLAVIVVTEHWVLLSRLRRLAGSSLSKDGDKTLAQLLLYVAPPTS